MGYLAVPLPSPQVPLYTSFIREKLMTVIAQRVLKTSLGRFGMGDVLPDELSVDEMLHYTRRGWGIGVHNPVEATEQPVLAVVLDALPTPPPAATEPQADVQGAEPVEELEEDSLAELEEELEEELEQEEEEEDEDEEIPCLECDKTYKTEGGLERHIASTHP
jgi:hypothetical protein